MSYAQVTQIRQERAQLAEKAGQILSKAKEEKRELSSEEDSKFESIHADIEKKGKEVQRLERQMDLEASLAESQGTRTVADSDGVTDPPTGPAGTRQDGGSDVDVNELLQRFGRGGLGSLTEAERKRFVGVEEDGKRCLTVTPSREERKWLQRGGLQVHKRQEMTTAPGEGGEMIPEGFWPELMRTEAAFGSVLQAARIIPTSTGNPLPIPTMDDTSNKGRRIGEAVAVTRAPATTASKTLNAFKYTSDLIPVSAELLQDSFFPLDSLIASLAGERIGRILEEELTLADGADKPQGIVPASLIGHTGAAAAAISFDDFLELKHSVNPAYRMGPNSGYMFNDNTLLAAKKLTIGSADARPLWAPGIAAREPDTIDGSRYWINLEMADVATTAISALYGDMSKFWVRQVAGVRFLRLVERFADEDLVAFVMFQRWDSELIIPSAVRHLVHPV